MTRASTVLGAAPHPRGRCAAAPPTTVCPRETVSTPRAARATVFVASHDGLGIGQPRGSLRAWRRRKTRRLRAPRGAAARRGSPSLEKSASFFMWGTPRRKTKKKKKKRGAEGAEGAGGDKGAEGAGARRSDVRTRPADPSLNPAELSHRGTS